MTYEVQQLTLCDGWTNTWAVLHEDGSSEPETFETIEAALAAIEEFMADNQAEIDAGQREADEGYSWDDFRVVQAGAQ